MKHPLIPGGSSGELTTKSFSTATTFADLLLEEGYVVMISCEEDLYIINYIWSEGDANRNDVVFMDRCDFETDFYETEKDEEDYPYYEERQRIERDAKNSAWHVVAKLLSKSPEQIEEIFGVTTDEERNKFWMYYPDQILYDEARERLYQWERKQMADTEEAVMWEALRRWNRMSEDQCEGQYVMEEFDDQST